MFGDWYHVPPFHPGLASFVDCNTLEWTFGENFHAQFPMLSKLRGRRVRGEELSPYAVAWVALYPNVMIEAYNGLRVVSVVIPTAPDAYINRIHNFVPTDMEEAVPGLIDQIRAAYDETVDKDRLLVESRWDGLRTVGELAPRLDRYVPNLAGVAPEAGVSHF